MSGPYVLVPASITDAMVSSSTIAEPAAGELLWDSATSYAIGAEVILTSTHRVYTAVVAGIDAVSPDVSPRWTDTRPTQKWAAFDAYITTQSSAVTSMTYVLRPGIFNAIAAYGLEGATLAISIKDAPGGALVYSKDFALIDPPLDYYDYYFGRIRPLPKVLAKDLMPYADPEVTLTVTAGAGVTVKAGMFVIGDLRSIVSIESNGGTQYDAQVKPTTTSLFVSDGFGGIKIVRRTKSTDIDISVLMPQSDADAALAALQDVLDVPAAWIGSDAPGYSGLNAFGLADGSVKYPGPCRASMNISVKGLF